MDKRQNWTDYLIDKMKDLDGLREPIPEKSKRDKATEILTKLEGDPELFREFNTLLRRKKIKRIKDGKK